MKTLYLFITLLSCLHCIQAQTTHEDYMISGSVKVRIGNDTIIPDNAAGKSLLVAFLRSLGYDLSNGAWGPLAEVDEKTESCLSAASSFCLINKAIVGKRVLQSRSSLFPFFD